jgi:HEAT repeat protein
MRQALFLLLLLLALPGLLEGQKPAEGKETKESTDTPDEQTVKAAHLPVTGPGLVEFFKKRSLLSTESGPIKDLIGELSEKDAKTREKAFGGLVQYGMLAVPLLRQAAANVDDADASAKAKECLKLIETEDSANLISAAARLLATRNADGAVEALLGYLALAENGSVFQDVEAALVEIAVTDGKLNAALTKALKDPLPARRAAAASIVCQSGDAEQRAAVKPLLKDPRPVVRLRAALGLARRSDVEAVPVIIDLLAELPGEHRQLAEEFMLELAGDWKIELPEGKSPLLTKLRKEVWAGWWKATEGKALLEEFRQRSLSNEDREKVLGMIRDLGKDSEKDREKAVVSIVNFGPPALALLRQATQDSNARIADGARTCIKQLENHGLAPLPPVAARLLALHRPEGAAETLLGYVPFADSDVLIDAVQQALPDLVMRDGKADPAFVKALADPIPSRRIAAAEALARNSAQLADVRKLTGDKEKEMEVRFRTALALVKGGDKESVNTLMDLITAAPDDLAWHGEEYLSRLAGTKRPNVSLGKDAEAKKKYREEWGKWWKDNEGKVSLVERSTVKRLLGYTMVVEQYNQFTGNGRVLELDANGKVRWEIHNLAAPMDAQVLGEDRVLIAEQNNNRVTERNFKGDVKWEKQVIQPINVERLRNGNTFVLRRNGIVEMDRDGREVVNIQRNSEYIMAGARLKDGSYAYVNNNNMYVRVDRAGRELKTFRVPHDPLGGGVTPSVMPNGNALIGHYSSGKVIELDREGKQLREWKAPMPNMSTLVPGGNLLVASMNSRKVFEVDRAGKTVREFNNNMQPWKADRR